MTDVRFFMYAHAVRIKPEHRFLHSTMSTSADEDVPGELHLDQGIDGKEERVFLPEDIEWKWGDVFAVIDGRACATTAAGLREYFRASWSAKPTISWRRNQMAMPEERTPDIPL